MYRALERLSISLSPLLMDLACNWKMISFNCLLPGLAHNVTILTGSPQSIMRHIAMQISLDSLKDILDSESPLPEALHITVLLSDG